MTSPALCVLLLALVYSAIGITLERTADFDSTPAYLRANVTNQTMSVTNTMISNETLWTNVNNSISSNNEEINTAEIKKKEDEIYNGIDDLNVDDSKINLKSTPGKLSRLRHFNELSNSNFFGTKTRRYHGLAAYAKGKRRVKRDSAPECEPFEYTPGKRQITHPSHKNNTKTYASQMDCNTTITAPDGYVIDLTFVDMFHIEDHPECAYDYLQIRDGEKGYAKEIETLCGQQFPRKITTTGPFAWLKFVSDDTIEYEGFRINIEFRQDNSHRIPKDCVDQVVQGSYGYIGTDKIKSSCIEGSKGQNLDVLWTIKAPDNMKIYLNFTHYTLAYPNECEQNVIQVFGAKLEDSARLAHYCGSVANSVTSEENIMYVRYFASMIAIAKTQFNASFTAFRTLDSTSNQKCNEEEEFDCEDNTCIAAILKCDNYAHCRLKADEDPEGCKTETTSMISQPHILVILIIFSLILSGMSFIFLFKCIRKLYQDHKIIKEHIRQSCEDRLDSLVASRLTLDAKRLERDSEPRVSLERENHTNEMFKRQRSYSKHKPSSIDSDFPEVPLDPEEEHWRRPSENIPVITENVMIEHNGRPRRSDTSKKEESMRSRSTRERESEEAREKKEIRDVSVGAPDTKESGCQTRESLFQTDTAPSSDGSGSNGPAFSTFGYSGATIMRPSPPPQTNTSEITIELLSQVPPHQPTKSNKKLSDRRPMSTETTRSAPDVIIVSKPIR